MEVVKTAGGMIEVFYLAVTCG